MLAITHHFMVQVAARRVLTPVTWFEDYAVLGDDLVIANKAVADAYLIVAKDFGVEINLSKSLESEIGVAEFAKRILSDSGDLSPVSPRLISHLITNESYLPTVIRDLASRGLSIKLDRDFVMKSPLSRVRKGEKFFKELYSFIPFDSEHLGIAPFLETNTLSASDICVLLKAHDDLLNEESRESILSAVRSNNEALAKV